LLFVRYHPVCQHALFPIHAGGMNFPIVWYVSVTVTCKAVPFHDMKTYWGYKGITPLILSLSTRWREVSGQVVSIMTCPGWCTHRKKLQYPLSGRFGGYRSWSGYFQEQKNLLLPPGCEPWIIQLIA